LKGPISANRLQAVAARSRRPASVALAGVRSLAGTMRAVPMLRPFRGLRYAAPAVTDYSAVICPPYDVITPSERERLAARSPRNAVHLELPTTYDEAGRLFATWQRDGTLRRDDREQVYVYEQRYRLGDGQELTARGFMCRLQLEPTEPGSSVRAHEHTMSAPKEDRFQLMSAVRANLSPVILLYESAADLPAANLLAQLTAPPPAEVAVDDAGVEHRLWAVDAATTPAATLLAEVSAMPLTIADGHHRYATALRYCAEVGGPGADQVLALLFEAHTGGLSVLATHRLIQAPDIDVLGNAANLFEVTPVVEATDALPGAPGEIGVSTRAGAGRLRSTASPDDLSPVRGLDVSVLAEALPALVGAGIDQLTASNRIAYTQDPAAAIAGVQNGRADVAFLLAPTPVKAVIEVAAAGEVMPPKSTFFYPKAATGLVFNPLAP
jgi:uncharacterized protein (DUF1015 family)